MDNEGAAQVATLLAKGWRFRKWMMVPHIALCALAGLGPFVDGESFASPLFDTFRVIAPLTVWGAAWIATGLVLTHAFITHRVWAYIVGHAVMSFVASFWLLVLMKARWIDDLAVSPTAFGLWVVPAAYAVVALLTVGDDPWTSKA